MLAAPQPLNSLSLGPTEEFTIKLMKFKSQDSSLPRALGVVGVARIVPGGEGKLIEAVRGVLGGVRIFL